MAQRFTGLMSENLNDAELLPWIMPAFSTTTETDKVVASILMMGAMQKYFSFKCYLMCGIPSVTLLGERADWMEILRRIEKLPQLGHEPAQLYALLKPVLTYFVASFDAPTAPDTINFWKKVAHESSGSGPSYLSGWITAFCFWDADGKSLYTSPSGPVELGGFGCRNPGCDLGGTLYHKVNLNTIPAGYASVPVTVDDNGTIHETIMVAGSVGISVTSNGDALDADGSHARSNVFSLGPNSERIPDVYVPAEATQEPGFDSLQPLSGWWMYEKVNEQEDEGEDGRGVHIEEEEGDDLEIDEGDDGREAGADTKETWNGDQLRRRSERQDSVSLHLDIRFHKGW